MNRSVLAGCIALLTLIAISVAVQPAIMAAEEVPKIRIVVYEDGSATIVLNHSTTMSVPFNASMNLSFEFERRGNEAVGKGFLEIVPRNLSKVPPMEFSMTVDFANEIRNGKLDAYIDAEGRGSNETKFFEFFTKVRLANHSKGVKVDSRIGFRNQTSYPVSMSMDASSFVEQSLERFNLTWIDVEKALMWVSREGWMGFNITLVIDLYSAAKQYNVSRDIVEACLKPSFTLTERGSMEIKFDGSGLRANFEYNARGDIDAYREWSRKCYELVAKIFQGMAPSLASISGFGTVPTTTQPKFFISNESMKLFDMLSKIEFVKPFRSELKLSMEGVDGSTKISLLFQASRVKIKGCTDPTTCTRQLVEVVAQLVEETSKAIEKQTTVTVPGPTSKELSRAQQFAANVSAKLRSAEITIESGSSNVVVSAPRIKVSNYREALGSITVTVVRSTTTSSPTMATTTTRVAGGPGNLTTIAIAVGVGVVIVGVAVALLLRRKS